jgi:hypothetical protein
MKFLTASPAPATYLIVTHSNIERHANQHRSTPITEKETTIRNKKTSQKQHTESSQPKLEKSFQTQRTPLFPQETRHQKQLKTRKNNKKKHTTTKNKKKEPN